MYKYMLPECFWKNYQTKTDFRKIKGKIRVSMMCRYLSGICKIIFHNTGTMPHLNSTMQFVETKLPVESFPFSPTWVAIQSIYLACMPWAIITSIVSLVSPLNCHIIHSCRFICYQHRLSNFTNKMKALLSGTWVSFSNIIPSKMYKVIFSVKLEI